MFLPSLSLVFMRARSLGTAEGFAELALAIAIPCILLLAWDDCFWWIPGASKPHSNRLLVLFLCAVIVLSLEVRVVLTSYLGLMYHYSYAPGLAITVLTVAMLASLLSVYFCVALFLSSRKNQKEERLQTRVSLVISTQAAAISWTFTFGLPFWTLPFVMVSFFPGVFVSQRAHALF
jgi:hypothetical protein